MAASSRTNNAKNARPQMTAREKQRLDEKKRKKRKRRLVFVVTSAVITICAVLSGLTYGFFAVFKVTAYTVEGNITYTAAEVFEKSELSLNRNLLLSSIKDVGARLETGLPYIGSAEVKRKLPGTFVFVITETAAAVAMQSGAEYLILDKNGKILEGLGELKQGITLLKCPAPKSAKVGHVIEFDEVDGAVDNPLEIYKSLLSAMESTSLTGISLINMEKPTDVWLTYQGRIRIHLGTPLQLEKRFSFVVPLLETEDAKYPSQKGEIDLTILKTAYVITDTEN